MTKKAASKPTWRFERKAVEAGFSRIAGIDEAGRGPLAGPVVAAAVVFSPEIIARKPVAALKGINDSKKLLPETREKLAAQIRETALAVGVGSASAEEIDRINILQATHLAARRAVASLGIQPDYYLTDYLKLDGGGAPVEPLVKGDALSISIAGASIVAKTTRDGMMRRYDEEYPGYGFASHKGYTCPAHLEALNALGPCSIHRMTFNGVTWFDVQPRPSKTFERLARAIAVVENEDDARLVRAELDETALRPRGETVSAVPSSFILHPSSLLLPECERKTIEALYDSRMSELRASG